MTDTDDAVWMITDCRLVDEIIDDNLTNIFDGLVDSDSDSDDKNSPDELICNSAHGLLIDNDEGEAFTRYEASLLAHDSKHKASTPSELYDSGASCHM